MKKAEFIKSYLDKRLGIDIANKSRRTEYVFARALYFKLCGVYCGLSLSKQAKVVNRDHSTAIHNNKNVVDYVMTIPLYKKVFIEACEILDPIGEIPEDAIITQNNKRIKDTIDSLVDAVKEKQDKILKMELEPHERAYRQLPADKQIIFRQRAEAILKML